MAVRQCATSMGYAGGRFASEVTAIWVPKSGIERVIWRHCGSGSQKRRRLVAPNGRPPLTYLATLHWAIRRSDGREPDGNSR